MKLYTVTVYFLAAICLLTGSSDFIQGLSAIKAFGSTLPQAAYSDPMADNIFRFFAAIWFGTGVLLIQLVRNIESYKPVLQTLMAIIALGGIGRLISIAQNGMPDHMVGFSLVCVGLVAELLVAPILIIFLNKKNFVTNIKFLNSERL